MSSTETWNNRGTGRTTAILNQVCALLHSGLYDKAVFVVHHSSFDRYCVQLLQNNITDSSLYEPTSRKLYFRNKWGNKVSIYFVNDDDEYYRTKGMRVPVARDHKVLEDRQDHKSLKGKDNLYSLQVAGRDPWSDLYIPPQ